MGGPVAYVNYETYIELLKLEILSRKEHIARLEKELGELKTENTVLRFFIRETINGIKKFLPLAGESLEKAFAPLEQED
jgi:hypothetical protein